MWSRQAALGEALGEKKPFSKSNQASILCQAAETCPFVEDTERQRGLQEGGDQLHVSTGEGRKKVLLEDRVRRSPDTWGRIRVPMLGSE